jgi:hypothetical protein
MQLAENQLSKLSPQDFALLSVYNLMLLSEDIVKEAAEEHLEAFAEQMRVKAGVAAIILNEPYLEYEKANYRLQYLQMLERLLDSFERQLAKPVRAGAKKCRSYDYHGHEVKSINHAEPIEPQIYSRLEIETVRFKRRFKQKLDGRRQQAFGIRRYIWRSQDDESVRNAHGLLDDTVRVWGEGIAPGDDYGCRCWAEPILDDAGEPRVELAFAPAFILAEEAAVILSAVGIRVLQARRAAAIISALENLPKVEPEDAEAEKPESEEEEPQGTTPPSEPPENEEPPEEEDEDIFRRPDGVPEDWEEKPSKKGEGVKYIDPKDKGTYVRIQRGKPKSTNAGQKYDNVRWQKNGQSLDKNGNPVKKQSQESHILLKDFKFKPELFK